MDYEEDCRWELLAIGNGAVQEFQSFRVLGLRKEKLQNSGTLKP
jgi:hypothetical protein